MTSLDPPVDRCDSCGETAQISPRLQGEPRQWALRAQGWLSLPSRAGTSGGPRPLLCAHCLVAPTPRAVELLSAVGISPDAFVNLKPPVPKAPRRNAAPPRANAVVRKCASCGRWLQKSSDWTVRLGAELRPANAKLSTSERVQALWYCGSAGCQGQAARIAEQKKKEGGGR